MVAVLAVAPGLLALQAVAGQAASAATAPTVTAVSPQIGQAGTGVTITGTGFTGSLACTGNSPAPADNGAISTVSGTASGQCAAIAQR
jgi:hypothetical protein